ncbi:MAG: ABC transporter permease [Kosmotogaceae bacterium]|nr:ABC transporter permease [Kosmotogaceae bacterium]
MRLFTNISKEIILGWRSHFFLLTVTLAVAYFLLMTFLIPEDLSTNTQLILLTENEEIARAIEASDRSSEASLSFVSSRDELYESLNRSFSSIGIIMSGDTASPSFELIFQGHEDTKTRELVKLMVAHLLHGSNNQPISSDNVQYLQRKQDDGLDIPFNKSFLPIFLMFESIMMGMIMVFAMVFSEKSQKTLDAFAVTPGRAWEYLGAKVILLIILGIIFAIILTALAVGLQAKYLQLILIVSIGSFLSTSVSLIAASFYENLSQSMAAMLTLTVIFSLPMLSYYMEGFSPWYLRILPTFPIIFSLKGAVFPNQGSTEISGLILVAVEAVWAFVIAVNLYKLRMRRVRM